MFEWLDTELRDVEHHSVHWIDGPVSKSMAKAVRENGRRFPADYIEFVLRYGNARLFKRRGVYLLSIFATPDLIDRESYILFRFGNDCGDFVYFMDDGRNESISPSVFDLEAGEPETVADHFSEWLQSRYAAIRQLFSDQEWELAIQAPRTFTNKEMAIIRSRKQYIWVVEGVTDRDLVRIRIANKSRLILPYLTLAVKSRDGDTEGAVWLPVRDLKPGEEKVLEFDCYSTVIPPQEVILSDMPDPTPDDKDNYWEFRSI